MSSGYTKDDKDWRASRNPKTPLRRSASARLQLTPGDFMSRELSGLVTAKLASSSFSKYHDDPVGFCSDILGLTPTVYQSEAMKAVVEDDSSMNVFGRELGSTWLCAVLTLWWLHCRGKSSSVFVTAPSKVLTLGDRGVWDILSGLVRNAKQQLGGKITDNIYDISEAWYATAFSAADAADVTQTEHDKMMIIVDRADVYPEDAIDDLQEMANRCDAKVFMVGRKRGEGTWASMSKDALEVSFNDSPNMEGLVVPGLVGYERLKSWGAQASCDQEYDQWVDCAPFDPPPAMLNRIQDDTKISGSDLSRSIKREASKSIDRKVDRVKFERMSIQRFSSERLYVRDKSGSIVRFKVWPLQKRYKAMKRLGHSKGYTKFILLKYRRGGFTTFEQAESYKVAVTSRNARCLTLAHTDEQTTEIFGISRRYQQNDPHAPRIKGVGNARKLVFPELDSTYFTATASGNAPGRGDTLTRVHGSEVSKWCRGPNQASLVADLVSGFTEACANPEGEDGEIVMESTPFGIDGWFAPTYKAAKTSSNDWFPIFLPWFLDPLNKARPGEYTEEEILETLTEEEKVLMSKVAGEWSRVLSPAQIAWRRAKKKALGALFPQEYPEDDETCFLTSGTPFFPVEFVREVLKRLVRQYEKKAIPGGMICTAKPPRRGRAYVAGSDTSEGIASGDPNNCCIMDKKTGEQVAWAYGRWRPEKLAEIGAELCRKYNNAKWGIERQNHGHAVIQAAKRGGYTNLFKFDGKRAGWDTNVSTRPVLLDELRLFVEENPDMIRDEILLGEMCTFKLQDSGKFEHDPGCHDDTIFGWGIANQMRSLSRTPTLTTG